MFYEDLDILLKTILMGIVLYVILVFLIRASGKRTLSKWNAFDFVVTIALGSSLATSLLSKQVSLLQGIVGFLVLILLQYLVTWLSVRFKSIQQLIKSEPAYLVKDGKFVNETMRKERVTESEIRAALREKGYSMINEIGAVILETDGSFSVIKEMTSGPYSTLADVST